MVAVLRNGWVHVPVEQTRRTDHLSFTQQQQSS